MLGVVPVNIVVFDQDVVGRASTNAVHTVVVDVVANGAGAVALDVDSTGSVLPNLVVCDEPVRAAYPYGSIVVGRVVVLDGAVADGDV